MTQQATGSSESSGAYEGRDFVCHTCGCEVMVKHWGDPEGHAQTGVFLCHCGTTMEPEHGGLRQSTGQTSAGMAAETSQTSGGSASGGSTSGGMADSGQRDGGSDGSLGQADPRNTGGGAGAATGMGGTPSTSSSPGGG